MRGAKRGDAGTVAPAPWTVNDRARATWNIFRSLANHVEYACGTPDRRHRLARPVGFHVRAWPQSAVWRLDIRNLGTKRNRVRIEITRVRCCVRFDAARC